MMSVYRSSTPITTFYGSDYRPDDEPTSEAVLEEKRILDHQLRRPSPSRKTPSTMSTIRPPSMTRPGTSQSLRVRTSGSSPRRSLQRSTAFRSKRSITITDRGRTASMPAVPVIKVSKLSSLSLWKCIVVVFWITIILNMDPDPVILYRIKTKNEHDPGVPKATVISIIMKYLKALVMAIHAFKSTEIKTIVNDIQSAEQRLNCKASGFTTWTVSCVGLLTTVFELLFDYPWSSLANHRLIYYIEMNQTAASVLQLFLVIGLHFAAVLVSVYLFVFHTFALGVPWTKTVTLRFLNNLWRLSIISGAAHYAVGQALRVYRKLGQMRTSCLETEDIEEIEMYFIQYDPENVTFKLFGSLTLDLSLMILSSFGHVPRPDGPVLEEYRLRSFSITASGVCNLGDFVRYASPNVVASNQRLPVAKRDSCPASVSGSPIHQNATAAAHTVCTEFSRFRKPSTALINKFKANDTVESYKVALLGAPGVGKTTISVQFSTSEYICVYDTSIDEDCACRTIRVMINGQEAELSIIDIPYKEMSIETLCSTYNPNVFIVMYSIVDERSFDIAEQMLLFLWKGEYIHTRGVILVGNKSDLERTRRIQTSVGRNLAYSWNCKFIETSGGIDHNVDKLLVGILAQIKLNPLRERMYNSKRKKYSVTRLYKNFLSVLRGVKSSENLFSI